MPVSYSIRCITLSGGSRVEIPDKSIMVVVGPNNSGKSTFLAELHNFLVHGRKEPSVKTLSAIEVAKTGDRGEIEAYLRTNAFLRPHPGGHEMLHGIGVGGILSNVAGQWLDAQSGLGDAHGIFLRMDNVSARIGLKSVAAQIDLMSSAPQHPIHYLQLDEAVEHRAIKYLLEAFGQELIVNHSNGSNVPLHIGKRPQLSPGSDRLSREYREELRKVPLVQEQGDGIKAFVASILSILVAPKFVTLTDEPETFLHPPQARILGYMLGREFTSNGQLLIATHSGDILRGLLDSASGRLRVVRIIREGDRNNAYLLDETDIRNLWKDSILRFSNILDAIFHEAVVICESDSDCRFYSAVAHALADVQKGSRRPDVMFTSSGGKDRLPTIVRALAKLKVPTRVVADFDVLRDEEKLRELVNALEGNWATIESNLRKVRAGIEQKSPPLSANQVKQRISEALASVSGTTFPEKTRREIEAAMKATSPWSTAKASGRNAVPPGEATVAVTELLNCLKDTGLWVVPVGELESFDRSVGNHGPKWVAEVLQKNLLEAPELSEARGFVASLVAEKNA